MLYEFEVPFSFKTQVSLKAESVEEASQKLVDFLDEVQPHLHQAFRGARVICENDNVVFRLNFLLKEGLSVGEMPWKGTFFVDAENASHAKEIGEQLLEDNIAPFSEELDYVFKKSDINYNGYLCPEVKI